MRGVDAALDALADRAQALALEADDLAAELRGYGEGIEARPGRLDEVEERLALFDRLKRKHGGTIEAVLEHARECAQRRAELEGAEEALEEGARRLEAARGVLAERAAALRAARAAAAPRLADAVRERLAELAMEGASFEVGLSPREAPGPTGADEVEFLIAPNPGVPAGPLRETASGGELSRVMLALMSVAAAGGGRRRSSSTRSTPASAGRPRARSGSSCARSPRAARSSASPTCRRSPRWPTATSRSSRTPRARPPSPPSPSSTAAPSSASSCACSAPTRPTSARRAGTRRSCCRRHRGGRCTRESSGLSTRSVQVRRRAL